MFFPVHTCSSLSISFCAMDILYNSRTYEAQRKDKNIQKKYKIVCFIWSRLYSCISNTYF